MSEQLDRVLLSLRNDIANGTLAAGQRLVEDELSARLGVSRTPIRLALRLLEAEGLLERTGARSLRVRQVAAEDVRIAILARGALEGLAARELAARGLDAASGAALAACLEEGDGLLDGPVMTEPQAVRYNLLNLRFHTVLVDACRSDVLSVLIANNAKLPFAGANYLAYDRENPGAELRRFQFAHTQHHQIVEAIRMRDSGRAEALTREHANNALHYVDIVRTGGFGASHVTVVNGERAAPARIG